MMCERGEASDRPEQLNSITTLRSGKIIGDTLLPKEPKPVEEVEPIASGVVDKEKPEPERERELEKKREREKEKRKKGEEERQLKEDMERIRNSIKVPFPERLNQPSNDCQATKILELFKQVKINIPLLDAVKQIPSYAKFLKDMCTLKRRMKGKKSACKTEQVSSILHSTRMPKFKDPGCPTISCTIGKSHFKRALLDLGASVNVLPYSVYQQLGLGELKPTKVRIQLADRSTKIPRGIVEDVLVQVDKFFFPVDFIVLDMEPVLNPGKEIPVILGRPFLATSNAIINCKNGLVKLSFGNLSLELNVFSLGKHNEDIDKESQHMNMIEPIVQNHLYAIFEPDSLEGSFSNSSESEDNVQVLSSNLKQGKSPSNGRKEGNASTTNKKKGGGSWPRWPSGSRNRRRKRRAHQGTVPREDSTLLEDPGVV